MKLCKLLLASVAATVLLGALVSSASARDFEISEQRVRATFRNVEFHLVGSTGRCEVIVEGSLHTRTMAKVSGSLVGYITRAELGPCASGTATIHQASLPWHIRYSGFQGTLPEISSITSHIIGASFRVGVGAQNCAASSTATEPLIVNYHRNTATRILESAEIRGSIRTTCFGVTGSFRSDRGPIVASSNGARVTVNLI